MKSGGAPPRMTGRAESRVIMATVAQPAAPTIRLYANRRDSHHQTTLPTSRRRAGRGKRNSVSWDMGPILGPVIALSSTLCYKLERDIPVLLLRIRIPLGAQHP